MVAGGDRKAPPASDQVNAGWLGKALPNWSSAIAAKGSVPSDATGPACMAMVVGVWLTTTTALLAEMNPAALAIVTVKLYVPALMNVAVVLLGRWSRCRKSGPARGACPLCSRCR